MLLLFTTDPAHLGATPTAPGEGATATAAAGDNKVPQLTIDGTPHLPFQLQIEYTSQDGSRCTRVISQAKPTTKQREIAEKGQQEVKCNIRSLVPRLCSSFQ